MRPLKPPLAPARHRHVVAAGLAAAWLVSGCQPSAAPEGGKTAGASTPAAPAPAEPADGSPRIADSAAGRVHIQYRTYGAGEPLVVLIHGWSCDSNYWSAQLAPLRAKYTVVTVDLAGHGASGANRSDWSMGAFGDDVAAVVNAIPQPARVVLVGHSMGGPVAVEAARRLGERVIGVIGVDTLKSVGQPQPPAAETEKRMAAFQKDFIGATRGLVAASFFRPEADPAFVRRIADDMSAAPPEVAIPAVRALNAWDGVAAMQSVKVPIVAINADLSPTLADAIRKFAPNYSAVIVERTGHFLMMEDPARFNPILEEQIARLLR
jgi:pimeloyl-ACP methyl ester carboxylesterase